MGVAAVREPESCVPPRAEPLSVLEAFELALDGATCHVLDTDDKLVELPSARWLDRASESDHRLMLDHCTGPTLDVGCGPGRLVAALHQVGVPALGIDVSPRAVGHALARGGQAVQTDVYDRVPGVGQWTTALLADGNVGIGGDPVRLLERIAELTAEGAGLLVEVAAPGVVSIRQRLRLMVGDRATGPFRWSVVGADDIATLAAAAGWQLHVLREIAGRWVAELRRPQEQRLSA